MFQSSHLPLVAVLCGAILTVASLAFAGTVWQRRRSTATSGGRRPGQISSFVCLVASALLLAVSVSFHLFTTRVGNLYTHDLFVVRSEPGKGVPRYDGDTDRGVAPGEILLHFDRPASVAELQAMEFELRSAQSECDRIRAGTVDIDPQLSRERTRIDAEHRHLVQRREAARSALGFTETQIRIEILGQQTRLHEVSTELERIRGRLATNRSELAYAEAVASSRTDLVSRKVVAPLEAQQAACAVETLLSQAEQLRREQSRQELLHGELESGVTVLQARFDHRRLEVEQERENIDADLVRLGDRREEVEAAIHTDLTRLERLRTAELEEQDCRAHALAQRLEQKREEMRVVAPAEGRILYRHPAPASTRQHEPILAFGAAHSVRARIKLGQAEADRIAEAGLVVLQTTEEIDEPTFPATFLSMRKVRSEPGLALVELSCQPSESAMRMVIEEGQLEVELDWAPPIYLDPVFLIGVLLLIGFLTLQFHSHRPSPASAQPSLPAARGDLTRDPFVTSG